MINRTIQLVFLSIRLGLTYVTTCLLTRQITANRSIQPVINLSNKLAHDKVTAGTITVYLVSGYLVVTSGDYWSD